MTTIPLTPLLLDSLVTRVEEGDALSLQELDLIGREVQKRPDSLDWRFCYAHALINSDMPHQALEVLKFEGAQGMNEILLHMVRARAYGAMERYPEAEAELKKILRIYPAHADGLRALALLRLQEGAPRDAIQMCECVLESDPLDDATKQILAAAREAVAQEDSFGEDPAATPGPEARQTVPAPDAAGNGIPSSDTPRTDRLSRAMFYKEVKSCLGARGWDPHIDGKNCELFATLPHRGLVRLSLVEFWKEGRGSQENRRAAAESLAKELERLDEETSKA